MNSKHVSALALLLILLGGIAWWVHSGGSGAWKSADTQAGAKVVPNLVVGTVSTLRINGGKDVVTLERKGQAWSVKERGGYPADAQKIAPLLLKLADLKVTQTEAITDALRPRLDLGPPGQSGGGIALDLMDAATKPLGSLIVGKSITRPSDFPGGKDVPTGRYLLVREQPASALAVSEPLTEIDANPRAWIDKTFAKVERPKTITLTSSGKPKWILTRPEEAGIAWQLQDAAKDEELDMNKAQEEAGILGGITMVDVVTAPAADALNDADVLGIETFDGLAYTLTIGKKDGENRVVTVSLSGTATAPPDRTPGKDEKPEDKAKLDKAFKDQRAAFDARMAAERAMDKKVFLVADASVAPLLKERTALLKQKPPEPPKGAGKDAPKDKNAKKTTARK